MADSYSVTSVSDSAVDSDTSSAASTVRWVLVLGAPLAVVGLIVAAIIWLLGGAWWLAIIVGLLLAVIAAASLFVNADSLVAGKLGAASVSSVHPRLSNLVEELCVRAGVREPELLMSSRDEIDAASFGRNPLASSLVVTSGAINQLPVVELEGLLAREIGRIRTEAIRYDTLAAALTRIPTAPLGSLGRKMIDWARGDDRLMVDDLEGARISRYPPGLSGSLKQIKAGVRSKANGAVDHLWASGPTEMTGEPGEWTLDARIALLDEL